MKKCPNCNRILGDDALFCIDCGKVVSTKIGNIDIASFAFGALGFFLPIIGIVMSFAYKKKSLPKAKAAGIGAMMGIAAMIVLSAIIYLILA